MGNKIPYDFALKSAQVKKNDSIYNTDSAGNPCPNKQGYRYNVSHPSILPLYNAYHKRIGVPEHIHLTSAQRMHFEKILDQLIEKKRGGKV